MVYNMHTIKLHLSQRFPWKEIAIQLFLGFVLALGLHAQPPAGYYNAATGSGAVLKTNLYNIINGHTAISYDNLWTAFQTTDDRADGKVWDMYSNCSFTFVSNQCGNYSLECDCYNREHSWPKSWFNDVLPMNTDMFHLVPTDGKVNGMRDNYPFGETVSPTYTSGNGSKLGPCSYSGYTGVVFEPIDEYKGDFARNYFYMATRYENVIAGWYQNDPNADAVLQNNSFPVFESWFLSMLGEWHAADPVSQKEIDRNNDIYTSFQHNRNPYIDHPEYVNTIWGVGASGLLTATPATLTGFTYMAGSGPSAVQSYLLDGTSLTPASGNISITGTANFEVSLNNTTFSSAVNLAYTLATFNDAVVYVRMKAGLAEGSYSNNAVVITGGGAPAIQVSCSGIVTPAALPEPSNYPLSFSAHNIQLQWIDATGTILPDGYLVRMSTTGFAAIADPVDGTTYPNGPADQHIAYGVQQAWFTNLAANTTHFFKIFAYKGSGLLRVYKTDGSVPQLQQNTTP